MRFEQRVVVAAPREVVWDQLMDVPRVAALVPGVRGVAALGDDRYAGTLGVRVGPIALDLAGELAVTERDVAARRAALRVDAADKRVGGAVKARVEMTLADAPGGATELRVVTHADVLGRIGEFGQPVIKRKADELLRAFAENLRRAIAGAA